jgi:hypothetical protein
LAVLGGKITIVERERAPRENRRGRSIAAIRTLGSSRETGEGKTDAVRRLFLAHTAQPPVSPVFSRGKFPLTPIEI